MRCRCALAAVACTFTWSAAHAEVAVDLPHVDVIGLTPLAGLGLALRDVPANVQVFDARELGKSRATGFGEFLETGPGSVSANAVQGNPYQPDIAFRGFTASPMLGVPQGLSVFQDGVRINEPFGDVVNWDLLPASAIASVQIIPGSNPLYGLNTLGGALAVQTKRGRRDAGTALEFSAGSFGRQSAEFEHGGAAGPWDWFATGNASSDHGWAEHNGSRVRQFFSKLGYQDDGDEVDASLTLADNRLEGTQTLPASFASDLRAAYTHPDINRNRLAMLAMKGRHALGDDDAVAGNVYLRRYRNGNLSSNVNGDYGSIDAPSGAVDAVQALNDRSTIDQTSWGVGLQLTSSRPLGRRSNQFVAGAGADLAWTRYRLDSQPAVFDGTRGTAATGDFSPDTSALTRHRTLSVYASDTLALSPRWSSTLSARYDHARIAIRDDSGRNAALDGDHAFGRLNLALGLTFNPSARLTLYSAYNEGMRAPTAMELTCADPAAPCKLPNSFVADPPLKKVVAKTIEAGARARDGDTTWSVAVYRTELADDIQFVSSGNAANAGFFQNVGRTRRQGLELMTGSRWGRVALSARYSAIDATYRSGFVEHSPANSSADSAGDIAVASGNRMPGLPRQSLRVRIDVQASGSLSLGANLCASSATVLRGDENNRDRHGQVPGFAVLNLDATRRLSAAGELFMRVSNVLDRRTANFGVLGSNVFANATRRFDPAHAVAEPFLGEGAPRGAWLGLRWAWR